MNEKQFHRTEEVPFDQVVPDGNTGATLYRTYVRKAEVPVQIPHGLGRPPIGIVLWDRDNSFCDFFVTEKTADYALVTFLAQDLTVTLRFS